VDDLGKGSAEILACIAVAVDDVLGPIGGGMEQLVQERLQYEEVGNLPGFVALEALGFRGMHKHPAVFPIDVAPAET
jgi:hypothetical protein